MDKRIGKQRREQGRSIVRGWDRKETWKGVGREGVKECHGSGIAVYTCM